MAADTPVKRWHFNVWFKKKKVCVWYHYVNTLSELKKPLVNVMTVNLPVEDYYI